MFILIPFFCFGMYLVASLSSGKGKTAFHLGSSLGLLISYLQVLSIFGTFLVTWPDMITETFNGVSFIVFNIEYLKPDCTVKFSYAGRYVLQLALPLIIIAIFGVLYLASKLLGKVGRMFFPSVFEAAGSNPSGTVIQKLKAVLVSPMDLDIIINAVVMMADFFYIFLVHNTFELFQCYSQPDGTDSLASYPGMECFSEDWYKLLPVAIIAIILYGIGIPAFFGWILYKIPSRFSDTVFRYF